MSVTQIVGRSAWTRSLRDNITQVARFPSNVLISGPSGTGKELIARAIHRQSPRAARPFVPVDCTSLSGDLFASHLFGHSKGAFTGANSERLGCFRAAEGGTILLDEIGELSLDLQSKLLRSIQERAVVPLGSELPIPVDVRIIAATNRDLAEEVRAGSFRLDLFYRLNVISLKTTPLRGRIEDIGPLAENFLNRIATDSGFPFKRLSSGAAKALQAYDWPGNVRELQNALERAAVFAPGDVIDIDSLPRDIVLSLEPTTTQPAPPSEPESQQPWPTLADVEREHIRSTLERTENNQSAAANLLKINRATLTRKINDYHVSLPTARRGRPRATTS